MGQVKERIILKQLYSEKAYFSLCHKINEQRNTFVKAKFLFSMKRTLSPTNSKSRRTKPLEVSKVAKS